MIDEVLLEVSGC